MGGMYREHYTKVKSGGGRIIMVPGHHTSLISLHVDSNMDCTV